MRRSCRYPYRHLQLGSLRRHHVTAFTELLRDTGRTTATINTYLSALKGI